MSRKVLAKMFMKYNGILTTRMLSGFISTELRLLTASYRTSPAIFKRNQKVTVISNSEQCNRVIDQLKEHCVDYNAIGFDCKWVPSSSKSSRRPVALLQLASHKNLCALVRLNKLKEIPTSLRKVLEDRNIVKTGVSSFEIAKFLASDYNVAVAGTLDLRHLTDMAICESGGLPTGSETFTSLCQKYINQNFERNWQIQMSNWELDKLSAKQIQCAANDAYAALNIFQMLAKKLSNFKFSDEKCEVQFILEKCLFEIDSNYSAPKIVHQDKLEELESKVYYNWKK